MSDRTPPSRTRSAGLPRWALLAGVVALVVLLALDPFVHGHPKFGIDGTFAFYAWFGLLSGLGLVVVAKVIGVFLKRTDTYYDQ